MAAVETAIIFPILIFLTFGIVEFGIYWSQDHTVNEAARAGARLGATKARELNYNERVVAEVTARVSSLGDDQVERLTIYKADPVTGEPLSGTVETCSVDCYRYTWNSGTRTFTPVTGPEWPANQQAACGENGHNDYIGVYLEASWQSPSGIFGGERSLKETSILRLEPVPLTGLCE